MEFVSRRRLRKVGINQYLQSVNVFNNTGDTINECNTFINVNNLFLLQNYGSMSIPKFGSVVMLKTPH